MKLRFGSLALGGVAALTAALLASNDARACGGCFHPENQPETTLVTGHRMALSISQAQTVLWDQVQYSGSPSEFAWVLPVKPGAHVELANNAWFEALDAATSTRVVAPQLNCVQQAFDEGGGSSPGCGCGSASFADSASGGSGDPGVVAPPPVTVVHQGSVGPYDTVTLHANVPGSLTSWLTTHGFAIDASIKPIIDAYTADGFDFIALRLKPDQGIQQMQPVRVVSPGAVPVLPLRMVAAGTGANVDITLFVLGEGRWGTKNFPGAALDATKLSWDFSTNASNYSTLRADLLATGSGRTWLSAYAKHGSLLSAITNPVSGSPVVYTTAADTAGNIFGASTIAELYVRQGLSEGVMDNGDCLGAFQQYQQSSDLVVDVCPDAGNGAGGGGAGAGGASAGGAGGNGTSTSTSSSGGGGAPACGTTKQGEIDARIFACGSLDDLAVALTGTHPSDVWITRLESNLPHAALVDDLQIEASAGQTEVENWLSAVTPVNPPCTLAAPPILAPKTGGGGTPRRRGGFGDLAALATGLAALGAMMGRRTTRRVRTA